MASRKELAHIKNILRQQLPLLSKQYKVDSIGLFGSYVRHEEDERSDLDILVSFQDAPGLPKFVELEYYLSDLLGLKVDLVMETALEPRVSEHVLDEVVPV